MDLTINKLFSGLYLFGVATILLVLFDIQYFYLRAIFSFIFLTTIPGLLIMLMLKIRNIGFWEYLVYTIGLSIAFLMFAGLAVNWTFPWLHITDKPLFLIPLLISFNILLIIFGVIAYVRNKDLAFQLSLPKLNRTNKVFFIAPIIFPILSILGATTLNNGGPNYLTIIMLGGIAVYVFLVVLFRNKLNENVYPWSIWMMSISLLLMGWLRSWYVSGVDINLEYHIFQLVKSNQLWNMSLFNNAYNACLSVSLLPTIFSLFTKINDQYIFKLIIPLIFSITPVCVYLFLRRYTQYVFAFVASIFFMSQSTFMSWWSIPIRQEVAFLFFALALLSLFNRSISSTPKNLLILAFLFSMVVSHYSTTYIALALFVFTYLICLFFRKSEDKKYFSKIYEKLNLREKGEIEKRKHYLSGIIIILCIIFTFLWYAQLTKISNNFVDFTYKTIQNMGKIFSEDVRTEGASFGSQLNIFYKQPDETFLLQDYIKELTAANKNNTYNQKEYEKYKSEVIYFDSLPPRINLDISSKIYLFGNIVQKLVKIFIAVGVFYLIIFKFRKKEIDMEYILLAICSLLILTAVMILPFASIEYDLMRTYQQALILLSLPSVLGGLVIFNFLKKESFKIYALLIVFLLFFLFLSGFIPQIAGGADPFLQLNNSGSSYNEFYVHEAEIKSSNWLFENRAKDKIIYADARASYKLLFLNNVDMGKIIENVFPPVIEKNAYVYSGYTNTFENMAFINVKGETISYNFPTEFLNQNKNKIYNNGESKIFK